LLELEETGLYTVRCYSKSDDVFTPFDKDELVEDSQIVQFVGRPTHTLRGGKVKFVDFQFQFALQ
jgi:hypothetical protein